MKAVGYVLKPYLTLGDGVLDIGAHVGDHARAYCEVVGPTGYVLAAEPYETSVQALEAKTKDFPQLHVVHAAVGSSVGTTSLYRDKHDARCNSRWPNNTKARGDELVVPMTTLDALAEGVPNLKAIKVDAQGAEADILEGGSQTLARTDLVWAVELWREGLLHAGSSLEAVAERFASAGWDVVGSSWDAVLRDTKGHVGHQHADVVLRHRTARSEAV